jgi:bifunctional N-acetylglucosamine-1-phosphate-uridyltransferase/glucosamine-1-phosphate-acetyltransferase GlmU-like protein
MSGSDNVDNMAAKDTAIVILAAGKGTRMRSELAKVLHRAGGRPLLEHVVRACQPLKPAQLLAVVGHQAAEVSAVAEAPKPCFNSRSAGQVTLSRSPVEKFASPQK